MRNYTELLNKVTDPYLVSLINYARAQNILCDRGIYRKLVESVIKRNG
jgi:hypothetical protein